MISLSKTALSSGSLAGSPWMALSATPCLPNSTSIATGCQTQLPQAALLHLRGRGNECLDLELQCLRVTNLPNHVHRQQEKQKHHREHRSRKHPPSSSKIQVSCSARLQQNVSLVRVQKRTSLRASLIQSLLKPSLHGEEEVTNWCRTKKRPLRWQFRSAPKNGR